MELTHSVQEQVGDSNPSFLSLPPELRNRIYELVVIKDDPITSPLESIQHVPQGAIPKPRTPGLLFANKQIRDEASPVYYATNEFDFNSRKEVYNFLQAIGPTYRDALTCIRVRFLLTSGGTRPPQSNVYLQPAISAALDGAQTTNHQAQTTNPPQSIEDRLSECLNVIERMNAGHAEEELAKAGLRIPNGILHFFSVYIRPRDIGILYLHTVPDRMESEGVASNADASDTRVRLALHLNSPLSWASGLSGVPTTTRVATASGPIVVLNPTSNRLPCPSAMVWFVEGGTWEQQTKRE